MKLELDMLRQTWKLVGGAIFHGRFGVLWLIWKYLTRLKGFVVILTSVYLTVSAVCADNWFCQMSRDRIQTSQESASRFVIQQLCTEYKRYRLTTPQCYRDSNHNISTTTKVAAVQQLESLCECYSHEISSRYSCRLTVRFAIFFWIWFSFFGPIPKAMR